MAKEASMSKDAKFFLGGAVCLALILTLCPPAATSPSSVTGNLLGFVFEADGATPVDGVVVFVRNVTTGTVRESTASDNLGIFKVEGLDAGIYALAASSGRGSYNSQDFFGVNPGETAKISIALNPYETEATAAAAAAVIKEQRDKGEAFIGRIARYLPQTREVEVEIEVGLLQSEDRLHVMGDVTDFYMDVRRLRAYGAKTKRVLSGQTALLASSKACVPGDFVYVVCKRGIPPFFLAPLGVAAIVAGSVPLSAIYKEEDISQFRIKK
jgi:hypothetical protein